MHSYTSLQQDRQARNCPLPPPTSSASTQQLQTYEQRLAQDERYEDRERRNAAARILESNEMLIWFSQVENESLPQTRHRFERTLAGFDAPPEDDDTVVWPDYYGVDKGWREADESTSTGSADASPSGAGESSALGKSPRGKGSAGTGVGSSSSGSSRREKARMKKRASGGRRRS